MRDSVLTKGRDTLASGLKGTLIESKAQTDNELNENEFNMPSFYDEDTRDKNDDLMRSSFIQEDRSNSYGSQKDQTQDIYAGATTAESSPFKNVSNLSKIQTERIQELIEQIIQGHDFKMTVSSIEQEC